MMRSTDIGANERHARIVLDSYRRLLGKPLLETEGRGSAAEQLFEAPIAVLSHGTEADPVLNYGKRTALGLWEMDGASFTSMPSRLTAEPLVREERQRFMEAVAAKGYIDDYSGVRISGTGRRFRIEQAVVWNLYDESGAYYGQAAAFAGYTRL